MFEGDTMGLVNFWEHCGRSDSGVYGDASKVIYSTVFQ